jgi:hypothetical protein
MKQIDIYNQGKKVGEIIDRVYITHRDSRKHFYRKMQGYPISVSVLKTLKKNNVHMIQIIEHRANGDIKNYTAYLSDFTYFSQFQEMGHDPQKCIPLRLMKLLD